MNKAAKICTEQHRKYRSMLNFQLFKGKHSETKGCAKPNMIRPQHVDKRKLNKCTPVY